MEGGTRSFMEARFGTDFSHVRVHTDAKARESAEDVNANAYTVGHHIVIGSQHGSTNHRLIAHELAHVVQQSRGGVPAGIDGDPSLEESATRAAASIVSGDTSAVVAGQSGLRLARDAKSAAPATEVYYEVNFPEGKRHLTATEFAAYKQQAMQRLRRRLQYVADMADLGRSSQVDMLKDYHGGVESLWDVVKKPKALIGIASDIKAGVTPPYLGMWAHPKSAVTQGLAALDRGDLSAAAHALSRADQNYRNCMHEWNAYREATIGGAEKVASNLETVRDVSFAIALVAGAVVAAPVIAGGVAAAGATGGLATGLTALGTAGVTGVGGATLGGGSSALGSYAATGKVDTKDAAEQAKKWGKQGAVTGLTVGLGSAVGATGKAAELAKPFAQQAVRRCLADAGINVAGEVTTQALDKLLPETPHAAGAAPQPTSAVPGPVRAALTGCISGALGVPVGRLPGATKKVTDLTVGAGVGYADARLSGQSHDVAVASALQNAATSAAVGHAQPPKGAHAPGAPPPGAREPHPTAAKPAHQPETHPPAAQQDGPAAAPAQPKEATTPTQTAPPKAGKAPEAGPQAAQAPPAKKALVGDTAPAILKEEAVAKRPTEDGHDIVVTKDGIGRCSPSPCPVIHVEFAKELEANPALKKQNERIQELRKTNPEEAAKQADALIRTLEAERHNQARKSERGRDELDEALDRGFDEAVSPSVSKGQKKYLAASAETDSGKKKVPNEAKPRVDLEDLVPTAAEQNEKHPQRAAARRVRSVVGRTIADHPVLQAHWDAAVAKVTAKEPLSQSNYVEHYNKTRDEFWKTVRGDPDAAAVFNGAGFDFGDGNAPLLAVRDTSAVPVEERRVSLDHMVEKKADWTLALTPSNLSFELHTPNSVREIKQMRHPELRPPRP
jgi:hypothetical protein